MTTYTVLTEDQSDPFAPLNSPLIKALWKNVLAIQEGDGTAPNLLLGYAKKSSAGGIGTYTFAYSANGANIAHGSVVSGSALAPCSAVRNLQIEQGSNTSAGERVFQSNSSGSLAGTWRCMGHYDHQFAESGGDWVGGDAFGGTLFLRLN